MQSSALCDWCQKTVFNEDFLAMMKHTVTKDAPTVQGPFSMVHDFSAYYTNRSWTPGFQGSFRQNSEVLLANVSRGCIFCMLLKGLQGRLLADFEFSIIVESAWKWSTVTIAPIDEEEEEEEEAEEESRTGYFRIYETVNTTKLGHDGSTFGSLHIPEQDAIVYPENSGLLQQGSSMSQQLARDGRALRMLIDDCQVNHPECKRQEKSGHPSMLLHVSGNSILPTVRLVEVSKIEAVPIQYVCLSYCWGGLQPNMTTTSRLKSYKAGINTAEIPQTILDAIRVTISMGYQYMWVDSFCIVQDNGPDKIAEIGQMGSIYSGAACTICIMSAKSATEGFLQHSYQDESDDQSIRTWHAGIYEVSSQEAGAILEIRSDFSDDDILESPILERGWTFQEALLSPRLVMFFPHGQRPALRCSKYTVQTDGGKPRFHPKALVGIKGIERVVDRARLKGGEYYIHKAKLEEWTSIVMQFSQRLFTYQTDKMPAMMGIASEWEALFNQGSYCAGLWSTMLGKSLMWKADTDYSPRAACEPYVAPSWSWASRAHPVEFQSMGEINSDNGVFEMISCEVIPLHEALPNGMIKAAQLTVKCLTASVDVGNLESKWFFFEGPGWQRQVEILFDDCPRSPEVREAWLPYINDEEPYNNSCSIGIVVTEVDKTDLDGSKLYKRVGTFVGGRDAFDDCSKGTFTII